MIGDQTLKRLQEITSAAKQAASALNSVKMNQSEGPSSVSEGAGGQKNFADMLKDTLNNNPAIAAQLGQQIVKTIKGRGQVNFSR